MGLSAVVSQAILERTSFGTFAGPDDVTDLNKVLKDWQKSLLSDSDEFL